MHTLKQACQTRSLPATPGLPAISLWPVKPLGFCVCLFRFFVIQKRTRMQTLLCCKVGEYFYSKYQPLFKNINLHYTLWQKLHD